MCGAAVGAVGQASCVGGLRPRDARGPGWDAWASILAAATGDEGAVAIGASDVGRQSPANSNSAPPTSLTSPMTSATPPSVAVIWCLARARKDAVIGVLNARSERSRRSSCRLRRSASALFGPALRGGARAPHRNPSARRLARAAGCAGRRPAATRLFSDAESLTRGDDASGRLGEPAHDSATSPMPMTRRQDEMVMLRFTARTSPTAGLVSSRTMTAPVRKNSAPERRRRNPYAGGAHRARRALRLARWNRTCSSRGQEVSNAFTLRCNLDWRLAPDAGGRLAARTDSHRERDRRRHAGDAVLARSRCPTTASESRRRWSVAGWRWRRSCSTRRCSRRC